jgi:hypothetical protein
MDLLRTLYKETSPSDYTPEFEKAYEKLTAICRKSESDNIFWILIEAVTAEEERAFKAGFSAAVELLTQHK